MDGGGGDCETVGVTIDEIVTSGVILTDGVGVVELDGFMQLPGTSLQKTLT